MNRIEESSYEWEHKEWELSGQKINKIQRRRQYKDIAEARFYMEIKISLKWDNWGEEKDIGMGLALKCNF